MYIVCNPAAEAQSAVGLQPQLRRQSAAIIRADNSSWIRPTQQRTGQPQIHAAFINPLQRDKEEDQLYSSTSKYKPKTDPQSLSPILHQRLKYTYSRQSLVYPLQQSARMLVVLVRFQSQPTGTTYIYNICTLQNIVFQSFQPQQPHF